LTLFIYFSSFLIGLWNFFYFIFMGLSRSYDSSHEFSWLTWVDLIYYLGSFFNWMFFFSISPSNNSIVLFHVFFLQFHPSILSCLGIRFWNFFFNLVFVELTRSNVFNFVFNFNLQHWICWKMELCNFLFDFFEVISVLWPRSRA
jgi:hypothetical protein